MSQTSDSQFVDWHESTNQNVLPISSTVRVHLDTSTSPLTRKALLKYHPSSNNTDNPRSHLWVPSSHFILMNKGFSLLSLHLLSILWSLKSTLSPSVRETFCNKSSDLLVAKSMKYTDHVSPYLFRLLSSLWGVGHALPLLNLSSPLLSGQWLSFGFPPTDAQLSSPQYLSVSFQGFSPPQTSICIL